MPLILLLLIACNGPDAPPPPGLPPVSTSVITDTTVIVPVPTAQVDSTVHVEDAALAPAPAAVPRVREEEMGCGDYISGGSTGMRVVRYLKPAELTAHPEKVTDELSTIWDVAEQGAPVSIADDFEHGISTEHRHMPDTLAVEVRIFSRCADREPYALKNYGVWRTAEGGYGWRQR